MWYYSSIETFLSFSEYKQTRSRWVKTLYFNLKKISLVIYFRLLGIGSMCKLGELSKFLDYSSNVLEISSQLIWNIPVTYWKFPVGSKMILLFLDMFEAFKNSEKNRISLFHVSLPILTIKPSIYKGFSKLERIIIMVLCIFK